MFYIIGPERSAEAMARKNGLRRGEWKHVGRIDSVRGRSFSKDSDVVMGTHNSWMLDDLDEITAYIESHTLENLSPAVDFGCDVGGFFP